MPRFDLNIRENVIINFGATRDYLAGLKSTCGRLVISGIDADRALRLLGQKMQTQANDKTQQSFASASQDIEFIIKQMNALKTTADDMIAKLNYLESRMN